MRATRVDIVQQCLLVIKVAVTRLTISLVDATSPDTMQSSPLFLIVTCLIFSALDSVISKSSRVPHLKPKRSFINYHGIFPCTEKISALSSVNGSFHRGRDGRESIDLDLVFTRTAKYWTKAKFILTKCAEAVSYNTCEYFNTMEWRTSICSLIVSPIVPWKTLISAFSPPVRCPFKEGMYRMRNGTVDVDRLLQFGLPLEGNVFIVEVQTYDETDALFFCFRMEFEGLRGAG